VNGSRDGPSNEKPNNASIINPADVNSDVGNESNTGISSPSPPLFPGPEAGNYSKSQRFCEKIQ